MLEQMIQAVLARTIAERYPHLETPAILRAVITSAAEGAEYREKLDAQDLDTGELKHVEVIRHEYHYTLRVINDSKTADQAYPALPMITSRQRYEAGATVAIGLLGGQLQVSILGEMI